MNGRVHRAFVATGTSKPRLGLFLVLLDKLEAGNLSNKFSSFSKENKIVMIN